MTKMLPSWRSRARSGVSMIEVGMLVLFLVTMRRMMVIICCLLFGMILVLDVEWFMWRW
jgi:hypothetical protein